MSPVGSVVVVGAAAAGMAAAEALRQTGFDGRLIVVGEEPHRPYDRPPLSKQVLAGQWEPERILLRADDVLRRQHIDLILGVRAQRLDIGSRRLELADGASLSYDRLVVATGVTPRRLPSGHDLAGVHTLKTIDDALALRREFAASPAVVVVGGGFLGTELAATARGQGLGVTLVYPEAYPLELQFGSVLGPVAAGLHLDHGVRLRPGTTVSRLLGSDGRVTGVECADGEILDADIVVVCIGSAPATGWLDGSGLDLTNGVVCDHFGRAAESVYAAGDVASWRDPDTGRAVRVEHRTSASEQGAAVARHLLGELAEPLRSVPFFWTDQHGARIQVHGELPRGGELLVIEGSLEERRFVGLWCFAGRAVGVVGWNLPKAARLARRHVVESTALDSSALDPLALTAGR